MVAGALEYELAVLGVVGFPAVLAVVFVPGDEVQAGMVDEFGEDLGAEDAAVDHDGELFHCFEL